MSSTGATAREGEITPFEFRLPSRIVIGAGVIDQVGAIAAELTSRSVLLVTDSTMERQGVAQRVRTSLSAAGLPTVTYATVDSEPTQEHVHDGLSILRESDADLIVGLGGGSPLDTAKAVAALATNPGAPADYIGQDKLRHPTLPVIAIPTTAGTGSEVTRFAVITDASTNVKMLIGSPHLIPRVALVDYMLTLSCPPSVTIATGLDALTHALEAYISRRATPLSDHFALSALRRIGRHLRTVAIDGGNLPSREAMMLGATEAGIAFTNASVALVHGMARPIGAYFPVPHGLSNAILLPTVVAYTAPAAPARFADIAVALGEPVADLPAAIAATRAGEAITRLCRDVHVPSLTEAGVNATRLRDFAPQMARDALASGSPANNPRVPTAEEIVELYHAALRS